MERDKTLGRIAALLAHAEGTNNENEMLAFVEAAQRIATAASIDIELARARGAFDKSPQAQLIQTTIQLGEKGSRGLKNYVQLFAAIAHANDVKCDIVRGSATLYAFGYVTDIELCQKLYHSLIVQMVAACEEYLHSDGHKQDTKVKYMRVRTFGMEHKIKQQKPVATITARLNFQSAFARRVGMRLQTAREHAVKEHAQYLEGAQSAALILRSKDEAVQEYYQQSSQARGRWSPNKSSYSQAASLAGDKAGKNARLQMEKQTEFPAGALQLKSGKTSR